MRRNLFTGILVGAAIFGALERRASAYIEAAYSLGKIAQDSTNVVLMKVVSVDRDKNIIYCKKVSDIKGHHPLDDIKLNIAHAGFNPREWQNVMAWAAEGKLAVFCHNGGASETCIDNYWFQCYARKGNGPVAEWWDMYHGEPFLLRSFAGKPEKMAVAVKAMLAGEEVTVPCMVDGDKNALALRTARIQRMRASMKLQDYNAARDFAGWGGAELRPVLDMAGFEQISTLPRLDGESGFGVASGHLETADRTDLVLFSENKVAIMLNEGEGSFDEVDLPGPKDQFGGARAAAVADYNSSHKGSVLLATPTGPRLLTGLGDGKLRDDSAVLPRRAYWGLTAAAWVTTDNKDRPAILLADTFAGLRLLKNKSAGPVPPAASAAAVPAADLAAEPPTIVPGAAAFEDISDAAGLGEHGLAANAKITQLLAADLNNDGASEVIVNADGRLMILAFTGGKFLQVPSGGLSADAGSRAVAGDINGDGKIDIITVGPAGTRVWRNAGNGRFIDITSSAGLGGVAGTSAVLVPRFEDGKKTVDLLVGCLRGSNRLFRNNGRGSFTEVTRQAGLDRRIFNSRAVAVLPVTNGLAASADLVMVNEGQPSAILIWKK